MHSRPKYILPLIVTAQFAGTSLWFAGNAILGDLRLQGNNSSLATITSMVQFGFISGTLVFAIFSIADRFRPSIVFLVSSLFAALSNLGILWFASSESITLSLRFATGFFLAGIYPVGMKIASDWYEHGLGKALGFLVGALVLGTAFPHLLKGGYLSLQWQSVIVFTSAFAAAGGILIGLFIKDGPYRNGTIRKFHPSAIFSMFRNPSFRSAAFGYFGHMWELYTMWAFVPLFLAMNVHELDIPLWSFIIIGIGSVSCVAGGYLSLRVGNARVAFLALLVSCACCFAAIFFTGTGTLPFILFMIIWGSAVIADSPQFSALVARTAPAGLEGTSLSFVTSIGFAITIASITVLETVMNRFPGNPWLVYVILGTGPVLGLVSLAKLIKPKTGTRES
jgi:MFS family permease